MMTTSLPAWIGTLSTSLIAADMAAADINGAVSASGLARLLEDLSSSLASSHSTLTAAELTDLRTIAANLDNGMSASASLVYAMNALADGNAMNANWTGGGTSGITLGNLAVGASAMQLAELTGKWFLGTDLPSTSVAMQGYQTFTVSYASVPAPLFGAGGPSMNDVNQGYLGDCYFLASAAEVACQNAGIISSMFTVNDNNTCSIRFWENGAPVYVTVNDQLAGGGTIFNEGSNIWASLAEKAYTQLQAGGVCTGNVVNQGNAYGTIGNGGDPAFALEEITGASSITQFYASGGSWTEFDLNQSLAQTGYYSGIATGSLQQMLVADLAAHDDLLLSSNTNATDASGRTTLVSDHILSVYGFDSMSGMFQVRNPWGTAPGQTWDTTFEVSLATLLAAGDVITVDNAGQSAGTTTIPAPVLLSQTASQTWKLGTSVNFTLPANTFSDPQGEVLTYSAKLSNGSALPSWLTFDASTGTFTGTVPVTAMGLSIQVTATDTDGLSASEIFTVRTPATPPVLARQTSPVTFIAGKTSSFTLPGDTFVDPQGETLTYSARLAGGAALPSWLRFDPTTGTLTGTPPALAGGAYVRITATDTSGLSASEIVRVLTPRPAAPVVTDHTANQTFARGQPIRFQLAPDTFTDPGGEAMTYRARLSNGMALPRWLSFNAATHTFSGVAPRFGGPVGVTVIATDAGGASASETFSLSIASAASSLVQAAGTLGRTGAATSLTLAQLAASPVTTLASPFH